MRESYLQGCHETNSGLQQAFPEEGRLHTAPAHQRFFEIGKAHIIGFFQARKGLQGCHETNSGLQQAFPEEGRLHTAPAHQRFFEIGKAHIIGFFQARKGLGLKNLHSSTLFPFFHRKDNRKEISWKKKKTSERRL